jgi:hypothetical protein
MAGIGYRLAIAAGLALLTPTLAAATPTPPKAIHPERWITDSDYPSFEVEPGGGLVRFALSIDATGKPYRCEVTLHSLLAKLDGKACDLMMKRAHFTPATDDAGAPVPARWARQVDWLGKGDGGGRATADYELAVNGLPGGAGVAFVDVMQIVAPDGRVERCDVAVPSRIAALDGQACAVAARYLPATAMADAAGQPTRALLLRKILFRVAP